MDDWKAKQQGPQFREGLTLLNIPQSLARSAFAGVSFSPEGRGDRALAGYQAELEADVAKLREQAAKGGTLDQVDDEIARYVAGYRQRVVAYFASSARCVSSFIAGPSNFPAARMQKRNDIAHKRLNELSDFREHAMKAAIRNLRPDLRPIMAGDADAVERLQAELEQAEKAHAAMAPANKVVRAFYKAGCRDAASGELWPRYLEKLREVIPGISDGQAAELLRPDFCGRIGFPDYVLANSSANLRRMRQRLEQLRAAKAAPVKQIDGANGIRLEDDPPANRVRLIFPGKPDAGMRDRLKSNGFRWAPSIGAWQAYRNCRSMELAAAIVKGA